jgi:hypothetical protein
MFKASPLSVTVAAGLTARYWFEPTFMIVQRVYSNNEFTIVKSHWVGNELMNHACDQ